MTAPNKYFVNGVKKLFGLANTKIQLAVEAETEYTKPRPLPLVELLTARKVESIEEARKYLEGLKTEVDYNSEPNMASTTFLLMDLIEGVKHKFEPPEYCVLVGDDTIQEVEQRVASGEKVNILLMTEKHREGVNLFVGADPLEGTIHYGRVPTVLTHYLNYAMRSGTLSDEMHLLNTRVVMGYKTLLLNAAYHALRVYGAEAEPVT